MMFLLIVHLLFGLLTFLLYITKIISVSNSFILDEINEARREHYSFKLKDFMSYSSIKLLVVTLTPVLNILLFIVVFFYDNTLEEQIYKSIREEYYKHKGV